MHIVTSEHAPWTSGSTVIESMAPAWRANLGAPSTVDEAYALYRQRNFSACPTTRRFDMIQLLPGYSDATAAYHDTVEESLILEGTCIIDGEGVFNAGDYFWRPPGWVHRARTDTGFTALLCLEGLNPTEDSRQASRVVSPQETVGHRLIGDCELGERRARVEKINIADVAPVEDTRLLKLPWELDLDGCDLRVLGRNGSTGACTVMMALCEGTALKGTTIEGLDIQAFVLEGEIELGDTAIPAESLIELGAGDAETLTATQATALFVKLNVHHGPSEGVAS